jgi:ribosomal protein L37AE/L43A
MTQHNSPAAHTLPLCTSCADPFAPARRRAGYTQCMPCGEQTAKKYRHTIVPMSKSNYVVVTDLDLLKGLNKYANT